MVEKIKCPKHSREFEVNKGCPDCLAELWEPTSNIVKVRYFSETTQELSDREYTYFSDDPLKVGYVVSVPVRDTTTKAKVTAVNVPESEIEAFKDKVKTIPSGPIMPEPAKIPQDAIPPTEAELTEAVANGASGMIQPEIDTKINLCDNCVNYSDFPNCMSDDIQFGDGVGLDNVIACINSEVKTTETALALALPPGADIEVMSYFAEAKKMLLYAEARVIATVEDVKMATDDLSIIAKTKKAMEAKKREYLDPLRAQVDAINETYKTLMAPIIEADKTTRDKMTAFKLEEERKAREAEELNRQALEVAQKQAAMKNGEFTVDITPVDVPIAPRLTRTDQGTSGLVSNWKYEVIDITLLPREYMIPNDAMLKTIAKQQHDKNPVLGVRFYNEPYTAVRLK